MRVDPALSGLPATCRRVGRRDQRGRGGARRAGAEVVVFMISRAISSTGVRFVVHDFTMRVDDGAPIALPFRPLSIRAGRDAIVCVPGEDLKESPKWGGRTYLVDVVGQPKAIAPWRARGNNPVGISDDDSRQWLTGKETSAEYFIRDASGLSGPFPTPNPDHHEGFATVDPLRMHTPVALTRLGNVTLRFPLKLWIDLGPWLFGEHKDVWYAYRKADGAWFTVYDGPVTYPHTARLINGELVAAINGAEGGFVGESDFRRVGDATPGPPVTVPTFMHSPHAIGVGMFDDMDGPRLMDATEVPAANVRAVFHHVGRGSVQASMAVAKSLGWPCEFWWDDHQHDPSDVPQGGRGLVFGYATDDQSVAETVDLFTSRATGLKNAGIPIDVGILLARKWRPSGYALGEQHVLECAAAIWTAAVELGCGAAWIFSKHRGDVDGVDAFPSFQKAVSRMKGASPDWRTFPKYRVSAPTPEPPKEQPMTAPSLHQWITQDYPRVVQAWKYGQATPANDPNPGEPSAEWSAFQTARYYSRWLPAEAIGGEQWTLESMIAHELSHRPEGLPAPPSF